MIKTCNHLQRFGVKDLNMHSVDQHEVKELLVCITAMESHRICHLPSLQVPVLRQLHFVPIALCNKHGHKSAALSTRERQHFSSTVWSGRENSCICGSQSRKKLVTWNLVVEPTSQMVSDCIYLHKLWYPDIVSKLCPKAARQSAQLLGLDPIDRSLLSAHPMVWKVWLICWGKGDGQWGGNDFRQGRNGLRIQNTPTKPCKTSNIPDSWSFTTLLRFRPENCLDGRPFLTSLWDLHTAPQNPQRHTKTVSSYVQLHFLLTFRLSTTIQNYPNTSNLLDFLRSAPKDSAPSASKSFWSSTPLVASASGVWQSGRNLKPKTVTRCIS